MRIICITSVRLVFISVEVAWFTKYGGESLEVINDCCTAVVPKEHVAASLLVTDVLVMK